MALPLQALRHEITPLGPHHLLTHHDIRMPRAGRLTVGGRLERPLLSLEGSGPRLRTRVSPG